jgi:hypothetical protein
MTVSGIDRLADDLVVACQRHPHRSRVRVPQPRRALDISEQKRHRPRRQPNHLPGITESVTDLEPNDLGWSGDISHSRCRRCRSRSSGRSWGEPPVVFARLPLVGRAVQKGLTNPQIGKRLGSSARTWKRTFPTFRRATNYEPSGTCGSRRAANKFFRWCRTRNERHRPGALRGSWRCAWFVSSSRRFRCMLTWR